MATRRTKNPIEEAREQVREALDTAVEIFGFAGVLDVLADVAAERGDDETGETILTAIESAIEEITETEEEDEDEDDGDSESDEEDGDEE